MIIVSGANGKLGRAVVEQLLRRVPAGEVGVCVRDPERAADLAACGVRVRRGDFGDPASLEHAFEDAARVLLVSVDRTGDEAVRLHRAAIEAAAKAGVARIVYTSHQAASPRSAFAPMPDHAATEAALRECGVPYTSLRNGFYATTTHHLLGAARATGELVAPQDGPVSWTAHADLAEAAAIALTGDALDGVTAPLTGPEAVDLDGVAALHGVRRVVVGDEEYHRGLIEHAVPKDAADLLVGMFVASRNGEFATVDPALAELLGRPATPLS